MYDETGKLRSSQATYLSPEVRHLRASPTEPSAEILNPPPSFKVGLPHPDSTPYFVVNSIRSLIFASLLSPTSI